MEHLNNLDRIENIHTDALEYRGFAVYRGWNDDLANEIVELSRQPHITENTPGDAEHRFRNLQTANAWHGEEGRRSIYTLHGEDVAGLVWYGVRLRPEIEADYTFAIRMYEEARGQKMAHGFMKAAHHDFAERKGDPAVWLETDVDNGAARHLYEEFGYKTIDEQDGRVTMLYRKTNVDSDS